MIQTCQRSGREVYFIKAIAQWLWNGFCRSMLYNRGCNQHDYIACSTKCIIDNGNIVSPWKRLDNLLCYVWGVFVCGYVVEIGVCLVCVNVIKACEHHV